MNYLSHFVLAERDAESQVTAAASLLPDLLTYSGARRRTHRVPERDCCDSPLWGEICAGMAHHIEVDREFHSSTFFEESMQRTLAWLRAEDSALLDHWSLWLLRHVAIELAIDGWLVRDHPNLTERIYAALATLHADAAAVATLEREFATIGPGLHGYLGSVLERQWFHVYADPLAVSKAVDRIFAQLLKRRPKLRAIHGEAPVFTEAQWQALPPFVEAVFDDVRVNPVRPAEA